MFISKAQMNNMKDICDAQYLERKGQIGIDEITHSKYSNLLFKRETPHAIDDMVSLYHLLYTRQRRTQARQVTQPVVSTVAKPH